MKSPKKSCFFFIAPLLLVFVLFALSNAKAEKAGNIVPPAAEGKPASADRTAASPYRVEVMVVNYYETYYFPATFAWDEYVGRHKELKGNQKAYKSFLSDYMLHLLQTKFGNEGWVANSVTTYYRLLAKKENGKWEPLWRVQYKAWPSSDKPPFHYSRAVEEAYGKLAAEAVREVGVESEIQLPANLRKRLECEAEEKVLRVHARDGWMISPARVNDVDGVIFYRLLPR